MPDERQPDGQGSNAAPQGTTSNRAETQEERKERRTQARIEREARNRRIFVLNGRGVPFRDLATTYGMTLNAIAKIVRSQAKTARSSGQYDDEIVVMQQLDSIAQMKQGWANRAMSEAQKAGNVDTESPGVAASDFFMRLMDKEARLLGLDVIKVQGDTDHPIKLEADTAMVAQEILKMAIAAVKPWPGAGQGNRLSGFTQVVSSE